MKIWRLGGIGLICLTWIVAGLSAFTNFPYFSKWSWQRGLIVSIVLTVVIGIVLFAIDTEEEKE